jgi:hypothetical protein
MAVLNLNRADHAYRLLFGVIASLASSNVHSTLREQAKGTDVLATAAQAWLGVVEWNKGNVDGGVTLLLAAERARPEITLRPEFALLTAEAHRLRGNANSALRHFEALAAANQTQCPIAASRAADIYMLLRDTRRARRVLGTCTVEEHDDKLLMQTRAAELGDATAGVTPTQIYRVAALSERLEPYRAEFIQRWARALYYAGDDIEAYTVLTQMDEPSVGLMRFIAAAAMTQTLKQQQPVLAALIHTRMTPRWEMVTHHRLGAEAYRRLGLNARRIAALAEVIRMTEPNSAAEDVISLARAYRDNGDHARSELALRYLTERGVEIPVALTENLSFASQEHNCASQSSAYARARCFADAGDSKSAELALAGDSTLQRSLRSALHAYMQKKKEQP